jgi:hypothetical protein
MSNLNQRRTVASLSLVFAVLTGLLLAGRGESATAQDAIATHPIVGTWRFVKDFGEGPTVYYGTFHADGTYFHEGYPGGPLAFGVWEPTGERTVELRYRQLYVWEDRVVDVDARAALAVDEAGNALDGPNVYVGRYLDDGTIDYSYEADVAGTRVETAPFVPLETLIAETEVQASPIPGSEAEASPTP